MCANAAVEAAAAGLILVAVVGAAAAEGVGRGHCWRIYREQEHAAAQSLAVSMHPQAQMLARRDGGRWLGGPIPRRSRSAAHSRRGRVNPAVQT